MVHPFHPASHSTGNIRLNLHLAPTVSDLESLASLHMNFRFFLPSYDHSQPSDRDCLRDSHANAMGSRRRVSGCCEARTHLRPFVTGTPERREPETWMDGETTLKQPPKLGVEQKSTGMHHKSSQIPGLSHLSIHQEQCSLPLGSFPYQNVPTRSVAHHWAQEAPAVSRETHATLPILYTRDASCLRICRMIQDLQNTQRGGVRTVLSCFFHTSVGRTPDRSTRRQRPRSSKALSREFQLTSSA